MAGISKYTPYIFVPKNLSAMNKAAAQAAADGIASAADTFAAQISDSGSSMVNLVIQGALDRIKAEAQAKITKATAGATSVDTTI